MALLSKNKILLFILVGFIVSYVLNNPILFGICVNKYSFGNYIGCLDNFSEFLGETLFFILIPFLVFFIITYRMKEIVFQRWIRFAAWYVPLLILMSYIFSGSSGGWGAGAAIGDSFNILMLGIFYGIFVIVSIVKIIRAYRQSKLQ